MLALVAVDWTEYERGWGSRPDGTTVHASEEAANAYINDYNAKWNNLDYVPDEYSQAGIPRLIEVNEALHAYVNAGNNVWLTRASDALTWAPPTPTPQTDLSN